MPYYDFKCSNCGYEFTKQLLMKDYNIPCENPCDQCGSMQIERLIGDGQTIGDPIQLGITKPPSAFQERLREIQRNHPRGNVTKTSKYGHNLTEI